MDKGDTGEEPGMMPISIEQAKALSHPLRRRMLSAMNERERSPSEIAETLGEPLTKLYHHVQLLEQAGLIACVRKEQRRGTIEHYYTVVSETLVPQGLQNDEEIVNVFLSALDATRTEVLVNMDHDTMSEADEDLYLSVGTSLYCSEQDLRAFTEHLVQWVAKHRRPKRGARKVHLSVATFAVQE